MYACYLIKLLMWYNYSGLAVAVPGPVPNLMIIPDSIRHMENMRNITLSWGEPFNNFDPITNYTVTCSGPQCPQDFTTADNATRSYNLTNLSSADNYTFTVVASNSLGDGKPAVLMIAPLSGAVLYCNNYVM